MAKGCNLGQIFFSLVVGTPYYLYLTLGTRKQTFIVWTSFQDVDDLRNWIWNPKLNYKTSYLTTRGYQELFEYGRRFGQKFASFLEEAHYSILRPTNEQRTQGSVKAFVEGLQGLNRTFDIENYILNDPVARVRYTRNTFP